MDDVTLTLNFGELLPSISNLRYSRMLSRHPNIQRRLRDECKNLLSFRDGKTPTKEELKGMEYLKRVIHEGW